METKHTARENLFYKRWDAKIQEATRIANDLQRDHPDMGRSEALRLAEEFLARATA